MAAARQVSPLRAAAGGPAGVSGDEGQGWSEEPEEDRPSSARREAGGAGLEFGIHPLLTRRPASASAALPVKWV